MRAHLRFSDGPKHLEEHPPGGGGGVDPLVEDDKVHAAGVKLTGQVDQVDQGATESVEFGDDQLVPRRASLPLALSRNT